MKMKKTTLLLMLVASLFSSCKKDDDKDIVVPVENSVQINVSYEVDGQPLEFDTIKYMNDAGSQYGVSRMLYYLSQVSLITSDSSSILLKNYQYMDASISSTNSITSKNAGQGNYIGMRFNIGLDSALNITDGLPITTDNLNMAWPVPMGGGYHFMKYEGNATDSTGSYGFAMHLGLNAYLVECTIWTPVQVVAGVTNINLVMNLNEWFRNPEIYDFYVDGNYSMGVMSAMMKLKHNGSDVFTIQ